MRTKLISKKQLQKLHKKRTLARATNALRKVTRGRAVTEEEVIEALDANEESGKAIPENVQKLLDFMDETGGDLEDYVKLNQDT